jgi:hypothetical protein
MAKQQTQGPRRHSLRMGRRARVARTINELFPLSARTHLYQARREVLLAVRDVLDHAIARLETAARSRRLRRVRVE